LVGPTISPPLPLLFNQVLGNTKINK